MSKAYSFCAIFPAEKKGGRGYHRQQYSAFFMDEYTQADIILLIDTDATFSTIPFLRDILHKRRNEKSGRWEYIPKMIYQNFKCIHHPYDQSTKYGHIFFN